MQIDSNAKVWEFLKKKYTLRSYLFQCGKPEGRIGKMSFAVDLQILWKENVPSRILTAFELQVEEHEELTL